MIDSGSHDSHPSNVIISDHVLTEIAGGGTKRIVPTWPEYFSFTYYAITDRRVRLDPRFTTAVRPDIKIEDHGF